MQALLFPKAVVADIDLVDNFHQRHNFKISRLATIGAAIYLAYQIDPVLVR